MATAGQLPPHEKKRYGVLLLNMGGPFSLDGVEDYIYQLLADPDMVRLGWASGLQQPLARFIAHKRGPKVRKRYAMMGGSSPINEATRDQAELLANETGLAVGYAMRYTPPPAGEALDRLAAVGCDRIIVIPLYPQYSTVSTLSSVKDLNRRNKRNLACRIIEKHYDNPIYLAGMQELLRRELAETDPSVNSHILFVAHSIPEAYIRSGDPYASQIEATAALTHGGVLGAPSYSLAYQSQVGPIRWRGPYLTEALNKLVADGVKQLIVQPLSFVSECLETIFDLDIDFKQMCADAGIHAYFRVPTPMCSTWYICALSNLVEVEIAAWEQADA